MYWQYIKFVLRRSHYCNHFKDAHMPRLYAMLDDIRAQCVRDIILRLRNLSYKIRENKHFRGMWTNITLSYSRLDIHGITYLSNTGWFFTVIVNNTHSSLNFDILVLRIYFLWTQYPRDTTSHNDKEINKICIQNQNQLIIKLS